MFVYIQLQIHIKDAVFEDIYPSSFINLKGATLKDGLCMTLIFKDILMYSN